MLTDNNSALTDLPLQLDSLRRDDPLVWSLAQCQCAVWQFVECTVAIDTDVYPSLMSARYEFPSDRYFVYSLTLNVLLTCVLKREATGAHLMQCAQGRVILHAWAKKRPAPVLAPRLDSEHYEAIGAQRLVQRELQGGLIDDPEKRAQVLALYVTQLKYATSDKCALQLATSFRYKVIQILGRDHAHRLFGANDKETAPHIRSTTVHIVQGQEFVNGLA